LQAILLLAQLISLADIAKDFEKALGRKVRRGIKFSSMPSYVM
jgi:hypothetical protein